jgi:hypothetical protein
MLKGSIVLLSLVPLNPVVHALRGEELFMSIFPAEGGWFSLSVCIIAGANEMKNRGISYPEACSLR